MQRAYDTIKALIRDGAVHRKGFRLRDTSLEYLLSHARDELEELISEPGNINELGDLLSILLHYAIKMGWTVPEIEKTMLSKFLERFSYPEAS